MKRRKKYLIAVNGDFEDFKKAHNAQIVETTSSVMAQDYWKGKFFWNKNSPCRLAGKRCRMEKRTRKNIQFLLCYQRSFKNFMIVAVEFHKEFVANLYEAYDQK